MSPSATETRGHQRIEALDTLRFFSALDVVLELSHTVFPAFVVPAPLHGLFSAYSAVALFFVLSGYVLHLSVRSKDLHWRNLGAFTIKRVFRLYPLHFVALLLAAAVVFLLPLKDCAMLMNAEYSSETLTHNHHDARQWLQQASLISGGMDTTFVNPPIWTLAAEMRISLIFPLIAFVVARTGLGTSGILTVLSFLLGPWLASKTIATVGMIPLFCLGAFTAQWMNTVPTSQRSGLWVMLPGLVLYSAAAWMGRGLLGKEAPFYVAGLGAALMIAAYGWAAQHWLRPDYGVIALIASGHTLIFACAAPWLLLNADDRRTLFARLLFTRRASAAGEP
jgi:peptidoglycan/LPS O-acetylase OafA/YrhL